MAPPSVTRLSRVWFPSGGIAVPGIEDAHSKLIRAGFLRQSHSGIFHMLPLGRRVQDKVESLVARFMEDHLAASRVSLSSISAETLWEKSGRLQNVASELFRFSDRKDVAYLLAPTHEEEITSLVAKSIRSYKELPLRLYQITRKYRDEFRPRHGLLRGREFIMKDLYTFDTNVDSALESYHEARAVYSRIFSALRLPVLSAKASSGDMGGDLSHEYHLPLSIGEDRVVSCDSCDYVVNEEIADTVLPKNSPSESSPQVWRGITKDRSTLVNVWYPKRMQERDGGATREYTGNDINLSAIKSIIPDLDTSIDDAAPFWLTATAPGTGTAAKLVNIFDSRLPQSLVHNLDSLDSAGAIWPEGLSRPPTLSMSCYHRHPSSTKPLNVLRVHSGDKCPQCPTGLLKVQRAMELGHTFFLGTRYSLPLGAMVTIPPAEQPSPLQMGCHGIGISRVVGAVAEHLADEIGLNWPVAIAPFSCVIIPGRDANDQDTAEVLERIIHASCPETLSLDIAIDDRPRPLPWKLTDADLIGFPIIIIIGRDWKETKHVEVQCRQLSTKRIVALADLSNIISNLYNNL